MTIGPITIRWTKDIEAEAKVVKAEYEMAKAKAEFKERSNTIRNKLVAKLLHQNRQYKAVLSRWGLDMGLLDGGGIRKAEDPQGGGGVSIVVPSPKCGQFMD